MDNKRIDISWEGEKRFKTVLGLLLEDRAGRSGKFDYYAEDEHYGLILYWTHRDGVSKFPRPKSSEKLLEFAWNWVQTAELGQQPDIDGSCGRGWRIFNEAWGHVKGDWAAFCAIQPVWAMYGK